MMPQNELVMRHGADDEDLLSYDRRMLLMGKTGSGKSSAANIIFNDQVFKSEMSTSSVTRVSQSHAGSVNNRRVTVTDTPDFNFSTHTDFDSDSELKRALELCSPGAHVILLLLPLNTFTQHELDFICWFEQALGVEALRFTLVLFTHADKRHNRPLRDIIRGNNELSDFINRCGRRYHEFNIKAPANRRQVTELMEKIDRLVSENRNSCYTLEMMQEIERRREEEKKREEEVRREEERREKKEEEERREREHQREIERVKIETEICVRRELEKRSERENDLILEETEKVEKRERHPLLKQIKKKHICIFMFFAVVTGGVLGWNENSFNVRMFARGFAIGGAAAGAGVSTGLFCRALWKSPFVIRFVRLTSHENPRAVYTLVPKATSVLCGVLIGYCLGGNVFSVSLLARLAGAAGAFSVIQC